MKRISSLAVLAAAVCFAARAADLPVAEELIGEQTVAIVSVDIGKLSKDQISKTLAEMIGEAPPAKDLDPIAALQDQFKAAGGTTLNIVYHVDKDAKPETAGRGAVIVVGTTDDAKKDKLIELMNATDPSFKEKAAPECPKAVEGGLVWYQKDFKLPKADDARGEAFADAFKQVAKDQAVTFVVVPDEDLAKLASANMKAEEAALLNAVLGGGGLCLFTDVGIAAKPQLRLVLLAEDADGAAEVHKAAEGLLAELKKDAPPPVKALLDTLKAAKAGDNVQISINLAEFAKAAKEMMALFALGEPPAATAPKP